MSAKSAKSPSYGKDESMAEIAVEYGISEPTIWRALR